MSDRDELDALRRMADLEAKAGGAATPSFMQSATQPIANIPKEIASASNAAINTMLAPKTPNGNLLVDVGKRAFGALDYVSSPITGVTRALVSQPLTDVAVSAGVPKQTAENWIRTPIDIAAQFAVPMGAVKAAPRIATELNAIKNSSFMASNASGDALAPVNKARAAFEARKAAKSQEFAQKLITPKETPTVKAGLFADATEQGILNKRVVVPDAYERAKIQTVAQTGVKKTNSLLKNRMILDKSLGAEAESLAAKVADSKVIYSPSDMVNRLNQTKVNLLSDEPLLIGDGEKFYDLAATKMQSLVMANNGTPAGLLKARKDFDAWAASKSGFGDKATSWRAAVRGVRNTANNYIAEMVPTAEVKASLTKQSHLFDARDAINSKGAAEAKTRIGRTAQKINDAIPGSTLQKTILAPIVGTGIYYGAK